MIKKDYKGRCKKITLSKSKEVVKVYNEIQNVYVDKLESNNNIIEIKCNVPLENLDYTSDFVCVKNNNDLMIRECIQHEHLTKPMTVKLLDMSREYWLNHGVTDWGIVVNEQE